MIQKLNSRRGVTLVYALLLFLVAAMVSLVILQGALTTARRVHSEKQSEQAWLTLNSAAQLMRDELQSSTCTITTTKTTYAWGTTTSSTTYSPDGPLGSLLQKAVESADDQSRAYTADTLTVTAADNLLDPVSVQLTLQPCSVDWTAADAENNYRVTAVFSMDGEEQQLYLTLTAKRTTSSSTSTSKYGTKTDTVTQTLGWENGTISNTEATP